MRVSGRLIHAIAPRTILLNKPSGYTTTRSDLHAKRTIFELLPSDAGHLFHVGRLDRDSEGLLLLTNDGALAQQLMHPSKGIEKEYEVVLDKTFTSRAATALKKGTWIDGSVARVEAVRQLAPNKIQIILHQGLKPGSYRDLKGVDLDMLRKSIEKPKVKTEKIKPPAKNKAIRLTRFTIVPPPANSSSPTLGSASIRRGKKIHSKKTRKTSPRHTSRPQF